MLNSSLVITGICYLLFLGSAIASIIAWMHDVPDVHGPPGKAGVNGAVGLTGPEGDQGPTGQTGAQTLNTVSLLGFTGGTGCTGPTGWVGATGGIGITGPTGPQTGPTGLAGDRGVSPVSGFTGPTGGPGPDGATGYTGLVATGPVYLAEHWTYSQAAISASEIIPLSTMNLISTMPSPVPAEFTVTTGTITFNVANVEYDVRIGMNLSLGGLPNTWQVTAISLSNFPASSSLIPISTWAQTTSDTTAVTSVGVNLIYNVGPTVPVTFTPSVTLNSNSVGSATSITINLLSLTILHVSVP